MRIPEHIQEWEAKKEAEKIKEIKRVIREWIERMFKFFETGECVGMHEHIDCPRCLGVREIICWHGIGWKCGRRNCTFTFPRDLTPPSPEELKEDWERKKLEEKIKMFLKSK